MFNLYSKGLKKSNQGAGQTIALALKKEQANRKLSPNTATVPNLFAESSRENLSLLELYS